MWKRFIAYLRRLQTPPLPPPPTPPTRPVVTNPLGLQIARIAEGEIGVLEVPRDSNRGERVQEYQAATWLDGSGWPWCAAFICWCVRAAMADGDYDWRRPLTAGAWDLERWAEDQGLDIIRRPDANQIGRGDVLIYTFSHCGIATSTPWTGGTVPTCEGNTTPQPGSAADDRDGGGVYARTRRLDQIRSRIRLT